MDYLKIPEEDINAVNNVAQLLKEQEIDECFATTVLIFGNGIGREK